MEDFDRAREAGILIPPAPAAAPKQRVAFLTYFNDTYKPLAEIALPNFYRYCKRHGYQLVQGPYQTDPSDLKTYGDRGKIDLFNQIYRDYDIVMFLDIDALVMNQSVRIEDMLGNLPFLWTYDCNGPCSGFWIARCIADVFLMLNTVRNRAPEGGGLIARESAGPPHSVTLSMEPYGTSDQTMMRRLMNVPPYAEVLQHCYTGGSCGHTYPRDVMKWPEQYPNINDYEPGAWLVTFPAVPLDQRVKLMREYAQKAT